MTQTVIGVFDTPDSAYAAGDALVEQGIDESSIYYSVKEGSAADSGLKGKPMDAIRNFLSELFGPESSEEADAYAEKISQGSVLLSVIVPGDTDVETICSVIGDAGALDMETLPEQGAVEASGEDESAEQGETLPVIEEETTIGKKQVGKGKVRVVSRMVETPVREEVSLKEERATIGRRPVDQPVNPKDVDALAGDSIEVEETTEKPVISKSARITEQVELGKEASERTETVEDTERHTEVDVEREQDPTQSAKRKGTKK